MRGMILTACILALALAVEASFIPIASADKPERYCIVFEKAARKPVKDAIKLRFGNVIKKELKLVDVVVVSLPSEDAKKLAKVPGVIRIVPDRVWIEFDDPPPGKGKPEKPGKPKGGGEKLPWGVDRIDADMVWDPDGSLVIEDPPNTIIGSAVKLVVFDTGIDFEHPDLDVVGGLNTVEGQDPNRPDDEYGHGTICAGVVAALDNDVGYIGVAPGVDLYAVKLCGAEAELPLSRLYVGMEWCINQDMQVISMSFGLEDAEGNPVDDETFRNLITQAYNADIVLVASAGNDDEDISVNPHYPASYPEVIAVSATGIKTTKGKPSERQEVDYFASWSNYGLAIDDLAAPGVQVETTKNGGGYGTASGTSLSCPHVAGVAALVLEKFGSMSPSDVKTKLKDTAEVLDNLTAEQQGAGLVDAESAVGVPAAPRRPGLSPINKLATTWGNLKSK